MTQLPDGYTVKYNHVRRHKILHPNNLDGGTRVVDEKGGVTIARIFDADEVLVAEAEAICHPNESYCKRLGRAVSLGRALKKLETAGR